MERPDLVPEDLGLSGSDSLSDLQAGCPAPLVLAEATAREFGRISLEEALALTALVAEKEPERRSRFAVRWLRLFEEDES